MFESFIVLLDLIGHLLQYMNSRTLCPADFLKSLVRFLAGKTNLIITI